MIFSFFESKLSSRDSMPTADYGIQDVWQQNLCEEFKKIRRIVPKYPYIAMDTEFPGVVARPVGEFKNNSDFQFQLLRCNVDLLKIIQVGMTFYDGEGRTPMPTCSWQFNFKFNLTSDMYAKESIDLLTTCGIQFKKHETDGVDCFQFAELLMTSGIILVDNVKWISFHSGYDFGYMLKVLTSLPIPPEECQFFDKIRVYFPNIYDVKYLMKSCKNLKGGLQEVADELEIPRYGPQHQAGSDSLLTGLVFFKMKEMFFEDHIDDVKYCGHLYGLGTSYVNGSSMSQNSSQTNLLQNSNSNSNNKYQSSTTTTTTTSVVNSSGGGGGGGAVNTTAATTTTTNTSNATRDHNSNNNGGDDCGGDGDGGKDGVSNGKVSNK